MLSQAFFLTVLTAMSGSAFASLDGNACERIHQLRMQESVIQSNIDNVRTTNTPEGGPYRPKHMTCGDHGCQMSESRKFKSVYEPDHPDANSEGYVMYADINVPQENTELARVHRELTRAIHNCVEAH